MLRGGTLRPRLGFSRSRHRVDKVWPSLPARPAARPRVIATDQIIIILAGALAGGLVNGLTGFGTALTAVGLWLFAIPPSVAAPLAILCSLVTQIQTLKGQRFLLAAPCGRG